MLITKYYALSNAAEKMFWYTERRSLHYECS